MFRPHCGGHLHRHLYLHPRRHQHQHQRQTQHEGEPFQREALARHQRAACAGCQVSSRPGYEAGVHSRCSTCTRLRPTNHCTTSPSQTGSSLSPPRIRSGAVRAAATHSRGSSSTHTPSCRCHGHRRNSEHRTSFVHPTPSTYYDAEASTSGSYGENRICRTAYLCPASVATGARCLRRSCARSNNIYNQR